MQQIRDGAIYVAKLHRALTERIVNYPSSDCMKVLIKMFFLVKIPLQSYRVYACVDPEKCVLNVT